MMKFYVQYFLFIILIHNLNFCECADFYTASFRNLVDSFKSAFSGLANSFSDLPVFAKNLADTLRAAIDEDCEFKCPNGRKPKPKPYHIPVSNGCGVPGLQIPKYIPVSKLEDCCTDHDICYGTCNRSKEDCDKKFKHCLYKICFAMEKFISEDLLKGCKAVARTLYTAVTAVGCKYYLDAQKEACFCMVDYYDTNNEF